MKIAHLKVDIAFNGEDWKIYDCVTFEELASFSLLEFAEKYCHQKQWIIMSTYH